MAGEKRRANVPASPVEERSEFLNGLRGITKTVKNQDAATIAIVCNGFGSRHHRPRPIVHDPEFITSAVSPSYHGDCCGRSGDQRPADRDERHGGSVAGHAAVDVHAPAVDSAFEIGDAPEPGGLQLPRGEHAASSPMAIHDDFTLPVE